MQTALLLVDLQQDFLSRPGLLPSLQELSEPVARVLAYARSRHMPVGHIRTRVQPSGHDRMPHWRESDIWACVAGTPGEEAPPEFSALPNEILFYKQFFTGFANPALEKWLQEVGAAELWIAGIYTHGCVRATVLDAYERGYRVTVVDDGIASTDPAHDRITRDYLQQRAARFVTSFELIGEAATPQKHYNPDDPAELIATVTASTAAAIEHAVATSRQAQVEWRNQTMVVRHAVIQRFASLLGEASPRLEAWMVRDLGKPRRDVRDELRRATGHIATALELSDRELLDSATGVSFPPRGVVALITPWNNPVAIPLGKLAAALILGNGVVWKPAFQADNISRHLLLLLHESGVPAGLVQLVNGGPPEVAALVKHAGIDAVSLTGPEAAGRAVAGICQPAGKPLQAELGGNNALLVLADAALDSQVSTWVRLAFSFAGQRCTALRRFVVEESIAHRFEVLLQAAMGQLQVTGPGSDQCAVGPLISAAQLVRVEKAVQGALQRGARLVAGGHRISTEKGYYYQPTLLADLPEDDPLVQEELFGPVAVLQTATDFEHGLALVNGVRQGLVAGIATASTARREQFVRGVEAGIVLDGGGMRIHPAAPFGGVKASQIGPPEHGVWDRQFFAGVRVIYRGGADA